jgi:NAD(P)-dependent dehydrogenase (short-subunit alcohol dehydrogenase family)
MLQPFHDKEQAMTNGVQDGKQVALVTGASSGIGEAIARRLLAGGWTVYAGARRVDRMSALAREGARLLALDVTDDASMVAAIEAILADTGRIDALVNNAGYGSYGAMEDVPLAEGRRQFEVNVFGLARLMQLVAPHMRRQRSGRILNVTSMGGKIHEPMGSWYHATKFAVEGMSDCVRMELEPFGVDVVVIEPGAIQSEWNAIARESLLRTSGSTAYAEQARISAGLLAGADKDSASPPTVVADSVWQAVTARKPKTRYLMGGGAKLLVGLRWLPSDRAFDRVMRMAAARMAKAA